MCVHTSKEATHIATLEGRTMVEYTVAKAADETNQIDGNIYVGRIQNVLRHGTGIRRHRHSQERGALSR